MASTENGASPRLSLATGILVLLGELDQLLAALEGPLAPGGDDLDGRLQRVVGELEAHLVVALAGGAVTDGVGAGLPGDLDLLLGDQRPRDRGSEQIGALIEGVGAKHREHVVPDELLAQVLDEDVLLLDAEQLGLAAGRLQLLALAEVGGKGHDLAAVGLLQPLQDDRRVQPAGVGQDCFFHLARGAFGGHETYLLQVAKLRRTIGENTAPASTATGRRCAPKHGLHTMRTSGPS